MTKRLILLLTMPILLMAACSKPPVQIDRVVVLNDTQNRISNVRVLHLPTRKIGRVNQILPQRTLDIGFPRQPMLASHAQVNWEDISGHKVEQSLTLPYDKEIAEQKKQMQLIYVIHPSGTVTAYLRPSRFSLF